MSCQKWSVINSPMPSNIIWHKFGQRVPFDSIIDWFLVLLLFMMTIVLLTPINFTQLLNKFLEGILGEDSEYIGFLKSGTTPFVLVTCNSLIIPQAVYYTSYYMNFETKSSQYISMLLKYFFYLGVNTIILPITGLENI